MFGGGFPVAGAYVGWTPGIALALDADKYSIAGGSAGGTALSPGDTVTVARAPDATRHYGIVVNGVTNMLDAGAYSYTMPETIDMAGGVCVEQVVDPNWYINPVTGDDDNTGFTPNTAKRTLAAVLPLAHEGDTVHAARGNYSEGFMYHDEAEATSPASRAVLRTGVTLVSDEGAGVTFITGASATADNADQFGRGTNAVRCVFMYPRAKLRGFTLCGGRTRYTPVGESNDSYMAKYDWNGGGVLCTAGRDQSPEDVAGTRVEDCIVSNCVALVGGAGYGATFDRCRLFKCRAVRGSAVECSGLLNTIVDDMDAEGSSGIGVANWYLCVNATLGSSFRSPTGTGRALYNQWKKYYGVSNTVVRGLTGNVTNAVNCVFAENDSNIKTDRADMVGCRKLTDDECALVDYCPSRATSGLVDSGIPVDAGEKDACGGQRVYNGAIDIGACEYDWRERYGRDIGRHFTVMAATPGVVESTETGKVEIGDGERLDGKLVAFGSVTRCKIRFSVDEGATATLTVNGVETVFASGLHEYAFDGLASDNAISLASSGGTVSVDYAKRQGGIMLIVQ